MRSDGIKSRSTAFVACLVFIVISFVVVRVCYNHWVRTQVELQATWFHGVQDVEASKVNVTGFGEYSANIDASYNGYQVSYYCYCIDNIMFDNFNSVALSADLSSSCSCKCYAYYRDEFIRADGEVSSQYADVYVFADEVSQSLESMLNGLGISGVLTVYSGKEGMRTGYDNFLSNNKRYYTSEDFVKDIDSLVKSGATVVSTYYIDNGIIGH